MLLGLQIAMHRLEDMDQAKAWYREVLGHGSYFDEPFYGGFNGDASELGLHPASLQVSKGGSAFTYWGVKDLRAAYERLQELGATRNTDVQEVGGGILVATVFDPWGNIVGLVENPHFKYPTES